MDYLRSFKVNDQIYDISEKPRPKVIIEWDEYCALKDDIEKLKKENDSWQRAYIKLYKQYDKPPLRKKPKWRNS